MVSAEFQKLSIERQCHLVGISRSLWYKPACPESALNLELMRQMDELFMAMPHLGSRQMRTRLLRLGYDAGRKRSVG